MIVACNRMIFECHLLEVDAFVFKIKMRGGCHLSGLLTLFWSVFECTQNFWDSLYRLGARSHIFAAVVVLTEFFCLAELWPYHWCMFWPVLAGFFSQNCPVLSIWLASSGWSAQPELTSSG